MVIQYKNGKKGAKGRRYICLVRQSDASEGTTSSQAQLDWMHAEGERRELILVADVVLAGLTGSLPGKRDDLEDLLKRKAKHDDFEVLLVQRCDRLTRGGSDHAAWFHHEAAKAGIEIVYPGEDIPEDGSYRGMILAAKFDAAREQARSIGQRSVQGRMHSIADGRSSVISRTPYGCDKLYLNAGGDELFIIRNLGDGRQHKLDPKTKTVLDTFGTLGGGRKGHYRKQRDEIPLLVPGQHDRVETVRLIFDLKYNKNWGGKRIADRLNRQGILSPTGRGWSQRQVESIYENPVYCGLGLGRRTAQGIFYAQGDGAPVQLEHDQTVLANSKTAPKLNRSPDDWIWEEQPRLVDMLPRALADKALPLIKLLRMERWERSQDPTRPKRSTSKHKTSEYILTGTLFAKQDGAALTGVLCGRVGKKKRYYRHRRGNVGYRKGSVYNKLVPAQELEDAVLALIQSAIAGASSIRQRVLSVIEQQSADSLTKKELEELVRQRQQVTEQVRLIVRTLDEATLEDAKPELDRLAEQRRELDEAIAHSKNFFQGDSTDPDTVADQVLTRLQEFSSTLNDLAAPARREIIEQFVERVEVDMETKDAEVSLRLPAWAFQNGDPTMRLATSSPSQTVDETHPILSILLGSADCRYDYLRGRRWVCYRCRRRAD